MSLEGCAMKKEKNHFNARFGPPFHSVKVGPQVIDVLKPEIVNAGLKPVEIISEHRLATL